MTLAPNADDPPGSVPCGVEYYIRCYVLEAEKVKQLPQDHFHVEAMSTRRMTIVKSRQRIRALVKSPHSKEFTEIYS